MHVGEIPDIDMSQLLAEKGLCRNFGTGLFAVYTIDDEANKEEKKLSPNAPKRTRRSDPKW